MDRGYTREGTTIVGDLHPIAVVDAALGSIVGAEKHCRLASHL